MTHTLRTSGRGPIAAIVAGLALVSVAALAAIPHKDKGNDSKGHKEHKDKDCDDKDCDKDHEDKDHEDKDHENCGKDHEHKGDKDCDDCGAKLPSGKTKLHIELERSRLEASSDEPFEMSVTGQPGHVAILILGNRRGSTPLPGVGTVLIHAKPKPIVIPLGKIPPSCKRKVTADLDCDSPLVTDGPAYLQVVTYDPIAKTFDQISNLVVFQLLSGDCGTCAEEADSHGTTEGYLLELPGIATDFVFTSGGQFTEREDGKARLLGVVHSKSSPSKAFAIDILFDDRVDPLDKHYPPSMSPKLELEPYAYVSNGGPIDPSNWHYYERLEGILVGLDCYEGAILTIEEDKFAFQVGLGANGKNTHPGGSAWLEWVVLSQPDGCSWLQNCGDGELDVDLCGICIGCMEEAGDHALSMPAFGDDFVFVSGGTLEEKLDGTAVLTGILQNDVDPLNRWQVDIVFDDKVLPLSENHPPQGSPKKELAKSEYIQHGGVVDSKTWHYYRTTAGRIVGLDHNTGLELVVTRKGSAFQVGVGANGKNTRYGASGWLMLEEVHSGALSTGDINVDVVGCE